MRAFDGVTANAFRSDHSQPATMSSASSIVIVDADCPLCGSAKRKLLFDDLIDVEDRVEGRYAISRCMECSLVYLSRRPTVETLSLSYLTGYHVLDPVRHNPIVNSLYGLRLRYRCRRFLKALGGHCQALLEVGCGDGSFVKALDEMMPPDAVLTGIDLMVAPTESSQRTRLQLIQGEFEKVDFPVKYDVVVMFNVLEHLADPLVSLKKIHELLNPGGLLLGEVPNWDSLWRKLFPRHWQGLQIPRHQTHFDHASLRKLLDAAGYHLAEERNIFDPGDLSVTLCNWITDTLHLQTPPRKAWFYFPVVILSAPIVWLVNVLTRDSGSMGFVGRKR
jgi:SAM-dependent methyltransferase